MKNENVLILNGQKWSHAMSKQMKLKGIKRDANLHVKVLSKRMNETA